MLFHFSEGHLAAAYPVGLGKPSWPTPAGEFEIVSAGAEQDLESARFHPGRNAPRGESRAGGSTPARTIPWAPTGSAELWGYGIHGTSRPSSVYHSAAMAVHRLHPDDIAELSNGWRSGTTGLLVYQPVLLAVIEMAASCSKSTGYLQQGHRPALTVRAMPSQGLSRPSTGPGWMP